MKLFVIGSPWHAILATSITRHDSLDSLYVIEETSRSSLFAISKILNTQGLDDKIIAILPWENVSIEMLIKKYGIKGLVFIKKGIKSNSDSITQYLDKIDEVFIFNVNSPVTRSILLKTTQSIPLTKIEDGIVDYLDFKYTEKNELIKMIFRSIIVAITRTKKIYKRNLKSFLSKIDKQYSFFPESAIKIEFAKIINLTNYKYEIKRVLKDTFVNNVSDSLDTNCDVLFIGQSLYEDNSLPLSEEIEFYKKIMGSLVKKYNCIIFKPHPRTCNKKKLALIKYIESNEKIEYLDLDIPVEALLVTNNFTLVIGMWSNPIIYGRKLFGIETYSLMHYLDKHYKTTKLLTKIHKNMLKIFPNDYIGVDFI